MSQIKQLSPKEGVTILAVKVPEGAYNFQIGLFFLWYNLPNDTKNYSIDLPFKCKLLGIPDQIAEEVWQGLVEAYTDKNVAMPDKSVYTLYKCYTDSSFMYETAKESGMSFLEANEVYAVNPLDKPYRFAWDKESYGYDLEIWKQAQANTGTWVLLLKM